MDTYFVGELLGTLALVVLGDGVVANVLLAKSKGENGGWITIATGWFVAVVVAVFVAQSAGSTNADVNPAVSLAKYFLHIYTFDQMLMIFSGQLIGAFLGAIVVWLSYLPHWRVTDDPAKKLMIFCTVPAIRSYPSNLLCEVIASIVLVVGVAAIFGPATHGNLAIGIGPYMVGILVWGIGLSLGGPTGYAINPARDLGPRIAHAILPIAGKGKSDWAYCWVPIVGPFLGGGLGAWLWVHFFLS